ncbi:MAG: anthranilate synthase component I [Candidatus Omnitrophica bacterium]|nr:anthranilate synthase component I [Candidatus Omnitrophota bacterium]
MKITPDLKSFLGMRRKGNRIPVYGEMLADMETPVSSFLKMPPSRHAFLLESVEGGTSQGRYSFVGVEPEEVVSFDGHLARLTRAEKVVRQKRVRDPLDFLKEILSGDRYVESPDLPRFCGGAVGYLGYDASRFFEKLPAAKGLAQIPDMVFAIAPKILVFDHLTRRIKIVVNARVSPKSGVRAATEAYHRASEEICRIREYLRRPPGPIPTVRKAAFGSVKPGSNMSAERFKKSVQRLKKEITRGEAVQIVMSQKFRKPLNADAISVYRALRSVNPSPYMFYLGCGDFELVGSSPEMHVRVEEGRVDLRPIAGTRPRGKTTEEDRRMEKELLQDPKERAEHVMLVDLGRNDLGRVCRPGTVKVSEFMKVEHYSHVMHIVSRVTGRLSARNDLYDVIRATFPAGTVSGAPKVRAMELIHREEPERRGCYAGLVGYLSFSGNFDSCIAIRTMLVQNGVATVQAGAGIVVDSDPSSEYKESVNKARGLWMAAEMAERGLE